VIDGGGRWIELICRPVIHYDGDANHDPGRQPLKTSSGFDQAARLGCHTERESLEKSDPIARLVTLH